MSTFRANSLIAAAVALTLLIVPARADSLTPGPTLAGLAQRAYDDTISWFWFGAGVGIGLFDLISTQPITSPIVGISSTTPPVVTTAGQHGYATGSDVWISGVLGTPQANSGPWTITVIDASDFALNGANGLSWGAYISGGTVSQTYHGHMEQTGSAGYYGLMDRLWVIGQATAVAYSWWKAAGSADAWAKLQAEWAWVNATFSLVQMQQCKTYATAAAQDDAAWAAGLLLELYDASGDPTALAYAQGMLDCAWSRYQDNLLGGGLWYDDTRTTKSAYQAQYALDLMVYYLDTVALSAPDATYLTRAEAVEAWIVSALYRNGQTVAAQNSALISVTLPVGSAVAAGNTASVTLTCSCISGSPITLAYTEGGSDTVATIASALASAINGATSVTAAGISATAPGSTVSVFWPAAKSLTVTTAVSPTSGGVLTTESAVGPGAGTYTYPSDGLLWIDVEPNGSATYGISQSANVPNSIAEGGSVVMLEAQMAFADLEALLYAQTGNAAYLARLNQTAAGMRSSELVSGTNIALNDRDGNVEAFAAYVYARDVIPLLSGAAGTQFDKSVLVATAWSAALNDRCPDGTYGLSWEGPCQGAIYRRNQSANNWSMPISVQAAAMIAAGYYASLH